MNQRKVKPIADSQALTVLCYACMRETTPETGWYFVDLRYPVCMPCMDRIKAKRPRGLPSREILGHRWGVA